MTVIDFPLCGNLMSDLQSVRRALQVLNALQDVPDLGVSDVGAHLGVSSSTAHRLLSTLDGQGYVRHIAGSRRYELGSAMRSIRFSAELDECLDVARVHMAKLRDASEETVHVAILSGHGHTLSLCRGIPPYYESGKQGRTASTCPSHCSRKAAALIPP